MRARRIEHYLNVYGLERREYPNHPPRELPRAPPPPTCRRASVRVWPHRDGKGECPSQVRTDPWAFISTAHPPLGHPTRKLQPLPTPSPILNGIVSIHRLHSRCFTSLSRQRIEEHVIFPSSDLDRSPLEFGPVRVRLTDVAGRGRSVSCDSVTRIIGREERFATRGGCRKHCGRAARLSAQSRRPGAPCAVHGPCGNRGPSGL